MFFHNNNLGKKPNEKAIRNFSKIRRHNYTIYENIFYKQQVQFTVQNSTHVHYCIKLYLNLKDLRH